MLHGSLKLGDGGLVIVPTFVSVWNFSQNKNV